MLIVAFARGFTRVIIFLLKMMIFHPIIYPSLYPYSQLQKYFFSRCLKIKNPVLRADLGYGGQSQRYYSAQVCSQTQVHSLFPHSHNPMSCLVDTAGKTSGV